MNLETAGHRPQSDTPEDRAAKRPVKPRAARPGSLPRHLPRIEEITRPGPAPLAEDGLVHIRDLHTIKAEIRGCDPASRLAVRQDRSAPILGRIDDGLARHRAWAWAKSPGGEALTDIARYCDGPGRVLADGRVAIDSSPLDCTLRTGKFTQPTFIVDPFWAACPPQPFKPFVRFQWPMTSLIEIGDTHPEILERRIKDVLDGPGCGKPSPGGGAGSERVATLSSLPIKTAPRTIFWLGRAVDRVRVPHRHDDRSHRLRQQRGEAT